VKNEKDEAIARLVAVAQDYDPAVIERLAENMERSPTRRKVYPRTYRQDNATKKAAGILAKIEGLDVIKYA
jgi:hypothetical protein